MEAKSSGQLTDDVVVLLTVDAGDDDADNQQVDSRS